MIQAHQRTLTPPWRDRLPAAIGLIALLAQTVVPFAHAAFEVDACVSARGAATVEDRGTAPDGEGHHASCPLCQFLSAAKHLAVSRTAPPRLGLETHDLFRPDGARAAACRVDVRTAGPRGPPRAA